MLLGEAFDPNSIGRYHRSPLWRAAYAGNDELIRVLLRSGGDPRECDEQGPDEVDDAVIMIVQSVSVRSRRKVVGDRNVDLCKLGCPP